MKSNIYIILFSLIFTICNAQPIGTLKHFSHDVKLNQSHILDIQQDKKGFIWLGTYNGLIRYDGNTFQNFEVQQKGKLNLKSNRVSSFQFDKNERIWIKSERDEVYYFDKRNITYNYPFGDQSKELSNVVIKDFKIVPSGRVWLFPENKNQLFVLENEGKLRKVNFDANKLRGSKIKDIYEDTLGTTWFLTDFGICRLKIDEDQPECFFFNMTGLSGKSYSFNTITEINDELWFGGSEGKLSRYSKKTSTFFDVQLGINADIVKIKYVKGGKVIIITKDKGFCYYDIKSGHLDIYNNNTIPSFPKGNITFMGLTNNREFWFDNGVSGIYQFDLIGKKLVHLHVDLIDPAAVTAKRKTFFIVGKDGTVWIQPKNESLAYWNKQQNKLFSIKHCIKDPMEDVSDVMHAVTFDNLGNLWFCSYKKGLDLLIFKDRYFNLLGLDYSKGKNNNVRALMEDKARNIWLACRSHKIAIFNSHKNKIGELGSDGTLSTSSPGWGADVYHIFEDSRKRIWVGTRGNGLFCLIPSALPFKYKVINYKYNELDRYSISANDIYKIFQSSNGRIYFATWGGGVNLLKETKTGISFINYRNQWKNYPIKSADRVRSIVENKQHQLFFISSYKLFSFDERSAISGKVKFKEYQEVSGNDILDILVTKENKIALATNGKGLQIANLNKDGKLNVQIFGEETVGFPIDEVVAIQEDNNGDLWLMGDNQIVRFNIINKTAETFPKLKTVIGNEIFSEATKCKLANGEIVVGFSNGAIWFKPNNIKVFHFNPYLAITGFAVNNKELYELDTEFQKDPDLLNDIQLKHDQNFIKVQFAALDYIKNENIVYRYKLEGVDKDWNYIKGGQSINYTNLGRGKYKLIISSTNSHNLWENNQREIVFTILPSIWWSNFAVFCYFLIAIAAFVMVRRIFLTIMKLRNDVQIEQELSELKLKFFTDISHEIRTPLTMITAPVEKMLSDNDVPEAIKIQLQGIERNSSRLLNLVNQILDLRRIQNRKLEIRAIELNEFIAKICDNFREISVQSKIRLEYNLHGTKPVIWADLDSLDKILVNLISNAFKYCKKGDTIKIDVQEFEKQVLINVNDNGPGINPSIKKRLFHRFSNYNENPNNPSTGIGLSIVKDLVEKHGASIVVDSEPGKGSSFQLYFLKGINHFNDDVELLFEEEDYDQSIIEEDLILENKSIDIVQEEVVKAKPVGLIVEDDIELRNFIISVLEKDYKIEFADNGIDGHLKAARISPDFIISDIMMPQMDGIEMLKLIRNNIATSHIPVILLSAKTAIESKLEGMEYGADEYMVKPFNVSFLKARVKNILAQRKRLQLLYSNGNIKDILSEEPLQISNQDHKFMFQVIKLVKDNVSKTDFSVEELGKLMHMSRASFFNKLKDLTGVSPVVFIRDIRLNEAAEMLKNDDMLIKEICFEVGFTDLKYFGKCFKSKFNYTPAEYRRLYR